VSGFRRTVRHRGAAGAVRAAAAGERDAGLRILRALLEHVETHPDPSPELLEHLRAAVGAAEGGVSPAVALGLARSRRGAPKTPELERLMQRFAAVLEHGSAVEEVRESRFGLDPLPSPLEVASQRLAASTSTVKRRRSPKHTA